jgi:hypothetical protein
MRGPMLFLDLDGVLLIRDGSRFGYRVADRVSEFLGFAVSHFETRSAVDAVLKGTPRRRDSPFGWRVPNRDPAWEAIERIDAVKWNTRKAASIDLHSDFYWIDDKTDERSSRVADRARACGPSDQKDFARSNRLHGPLGEPTFTVG